MPATDHVSTIYYHGTLHPERVGQDSISPVILSKATFMLITGFLSVTPDANRGNLLFGSIDCSAFNGAGLQVKVYKH